MNPFDPTADTRFLWLGTSRHQAFDLLRQAIVAGDHPVVLLSGDVGTGKTILANALLEDLELDGAVVGKLAFPNISRADLWTAMAAGFQLVPAPANRDEFFARLAARVEATGSTAAPAVFCVDEAQDVSADVLEEICRLPGDASASSKLRLCVMLVSTDEDAPSTALPVPIGVRSELRALTVEETRAYVAHRLRVAGREQPLFTRRALHELHAHSAGVLRTINAICALALTVAARERAAHVDRRMVRRCADEIAGTDTPVTREPSVRRAIAQRRAAPRRSMTVAALSAVGCAGAVALVLAAIGHVTPRLLHRQQARDVIGAQAPAPPSGPPVVLISEPVRASDAVAPPPVISVSPPTESTTDGERRGESSVGLPASAPAPVTSTNRKVRSRPTGMALTRDASRDRARPIARTPNDRATEHGSVESASPRPADRERQTDPADIIDWLLNESSPRGPNVPGLE